MMLSVSPCYHYLEQSGKWEKLQIVNIGEKQEDLIPTDTSLNLSTFNILFGSPFPNSKILSTFTKDEYRFKFTVENLIPELNPDILGLNEVIPRFLDVLCQNAFIRRNYYISAVSSDLKGYDSIIVSKYPFYCFGSKRKRVGVFKTSDGKGLLISASHLIAHEDEEKMLYRFKEIRELDENMTRKNSLDFSSHPKIENEVTKLKNSASQNGNVIIMGDMNFHNLCETDIIYELEYEDVWLNLKNLDPGYTWDPKTNEFIRLILPLDSRRMRLDRVMVKKSSKNIDFSSIEIFGKNKIGQTKFCYNISPSDHYGLSTKLKIRSSEVDNQVQVSRSFDYWKNRELIIGKKNPKSTGFASLKTIICRRISCLAVSGIVLLALIVLLIYFIVRYLKRAK